MRLHFRRAHLHQSVWIHFCADMSDKRPEFKPLFQGCTARSKERCCAAIAGLF